MIRQDYPALDQAVWRTVMPCGLRVVVIPKKGFSRNTAYLAVDYGSIHTDFTLEGREYHAPAGTAHYLEHKMFELPGDRDVSAEFAALGASVNAFTSYDMTAYYFSCTENLEKCLELLLEFVTVPWFTQESVDRERGIIDQEIGMNLDAPDSVIYDQLMEITYGIHPIRVPILGSSQTIREITPEILNLVHRAFYTPANLVLCVMGDAVPDKVEEICSRVLGDEYRPAGQKLRPRWQEETMKPVKTAVECRMEVAMPTFLAAFKAEPLAMGEEALRRDLAADLASEALLGESSELYLKLYEQGLIDSSFGGGFETLDGCAMLTCSGDSEGAETVMEAVLEEAAALTEKGVDETTLLRLKRSALGRRIRGMDSFDGTCFRACACLLSGFDYFRFPEVLRSITAEELTEFIGRVVRRERMALSVVLPTEGE